MTNKSLPMTVGKLHIAAFLMCFCRLCVCGEAADSLNIVNVINASGVIHVDEPAALTAAMAPATSTVDIEQEEAVTVHRANLRNGYRVQVYDDNNPRTARRNAEVYNSRISAEFPHMRTYLSFNSPYWRVKAGDFKSRAEAESAMTEIRNAFPALGPYLRIVRDHINAND